MDFFADIPSAYTTNIKRQKPRSPDLIGTRMSENTASAIGSKIINPILFSESKTPVLSDHLLNNQLL